MISEIYSRAKKKNGPDNVTMIKFFCEEVYIYNIDNIIIFIIINF